MVRGRRLEIKDERKAKKISQRKYVEYLLRRGTMEEKRELMGNLKNKLIPKDQRVTLHRRSEQGWIRKWGPEATDDKKGIFRPTIKLS